MSALTDGSNSTPQKRGFFKKSCQSVKGLPYLVLALVAGVILLLLPKGGSGTESAAEPDSNAYRVSMEEALEGLLCELDSIRDCTVVLTLESGYTYVYASDVRTGENAYGKETEKKIVLASENGSQHPLLLQEKQPAVCGIAAVCPGASQADLARAVSMLQALFSLERERISIQN